MGVIVAVGGPWRRNAVTAARHAEAILHCASSIWMMADWEVPVALRRAGQADQCIAGIDPI
jgi:hypothetical protein